MTKFKINPLNRHLLLAFGGTLITLSGLQSVQAQPVETLTVTGSGIKRIVSDEALPIMVMTKEEIRSTGVSTTEELMQRISIAQSMGGTHSSLDGAGGTSNYGDASISLRGLGSNYTLTLMNGRPVNGNLNMIPIAAIERVEILQDGASSIYGSSAVAGVVNFIMVNNFQGAEANMTVGTPTRPGGGQRKNFGLTFGKGDYKEDGFNISGSISVESEKELIGSERDFSKTGNQFPYLVGSATGQGNIEGAWTRGVGATKITDPVAGVLGFGSTRYGNPMALANTCDAIGMFKYPSPQSATGAPYCMYDSAKDVRLVPERDAKSLTLNGKFKLNNDVQLFGEALLAQTDLVSRYQPNPVRNSFLTTDALFAKQGVDPALLISPSNPNYKIAADYLAAMEKTNPGKGFGSLIGQTLAVTSRVFDFGPRTTTNNLSTSRFVAGARGDIGEHSWEAAAYSINSNVDSGVDGGYFSQVKFAQIVNSRNDWNPWASSSAQTAAFKAAVQAASFAQVIEKIPSFTRGADLKSTGPAFAAPGGQAMYATGLQFQQIGFDDQASSALADGDIAGLGGARLSLKKDRSITAGFAELAVPMTKDLELNGSVRQDRYSDFGTANTYKASTRWKASSIAVFRASLGTGFRAPGLVDLWTPQTTGTSAQFTDPKFPTNRDIQVQQVSGGNPDLKPERSTQNTIGVVLTPSSNFSVALDAWQINVKDKITSASVGEIVSRYRMGDPAYAGLVTLNPLTGEVDKVKVVAANIGSADYAGLDVNAAYRIKLDSASLNFSLFGTLMNRANETSPSGAVSHKVGTMVEEDGSPVIGADSGGVIVRWKHLLSASYLTGPWRYTLQQNFYTGYRTGNTQLTDEPNYVSNQSTYNMQVAYSGIKNLRLTLGVKNLLDTNPPMYVPASNQFAAGYDISMYDPRGRFTYLSANYRF